MTPTEVRKLATILAADVAGYSAHTESNDSDAAAGVARMRVRAGAIAASGGGRIFNTAGDAVMVEFPSASAALTAAAALLSADDLPPLRVGLHAGDVIVLDNGDLLGHGVNVAARLQQTADPGEALVSGDIKRLARGELAKRLVARGLIQLAKMNETVDAFLLETHAAPAPNKVQADVLLAVLPFDNQSSDADMQFFSDGVSEEILNSASRIAGLRVMGSASSFTFRGDQKSRAARELKASHILDGSVRRSGSRVRVTAQLVEAKSGVLLWSEHYDRQLGDVFALQDEIAAFAAAAISAKLAPPKPKAAVDLLAYDCFLRAREQYRSSDIRASPALIALLEEAVARAPDFADAWALLARVSDMNRLNPLTPRRNAVADAERAVAIDPNCALAYVSMAQIKPTCGQLLERDALFQKALTLAPDDGEVLVQAGFHCIGTGRLREALAMSANAFQTDPLSAFTTQQYAIAMFCEGEATKAAVLLRDGCKRWPESAIMTSLLIWGLTLTEDWAGLEIAQRDPALQRASHPFVARMLESSAVVRDPDTWRPRLRTRMEEKLGATGSVPLGYIAMLHRIGDADGAMNFAARASFERLYRPVTELEAWEIGLGELFCTTRDLERDPRAMPLFAKLGLCAYWSQSGHWPDFIVDAPNADELKQTVRALAQPTQPTIS